MQLLPIELGELRHQGVYLKLIGLPEKELAEYLGKFDTDVDDDQPRPAEPGETIRCPECGHEFAKI